VHPIGYQNLSQTDKYRENVRLLRSIPGIALLTAMVILTEVEDINRFPNSERFASFIGLIPMTKSSGKKQKVGEIIRIAKKLSNRIYTVLKYKKTYEFGKTDNL